MYGGGGDEKCQDIPIGFENAKCTVALKNQGAVACFL